MPVDPAAVRARVDELRRRITDAGGSEVAIVAVTKGFGADAVAAVMSAGVDRVGESYAQECVEKLAQLDRDPAVHFIGGLQRNKVRRLAAVVDVWQSVDRLELGAELARRAAGATVMVQVDISGETTKRGCPPEAVAQLVDDLRELGLDVCGLMGIARLGPPETAAPGFRVLRGLVDDLGLRECSMGMSDDLEIAIAEGSTMVRVGRDLFGPRPS